MKKYTNKLFCFSPPVMIATFAIEVVLAFYVLWRYKLNAISRIVVVILVLLAIFQLAEVMICGGWGIGGMMWSRIGYAAITLLPTLGVHLAYTIIKRKPDVWLLLVYGAAATFVLFFALATHAIGGPACQGNYVIFDMLPGSGWLYALYYYGLLLASVWVSLAWAGKAKKPERRALHGLAVGYLAFILPTTTVNLVAPETISGIPSIMCGFAVLLAFVLVFWVVPSVVKRVR